MSNTSSSSITSLVPGGVVTTQNISTVIKPKENVNAMQFVKIQTPELSKSAVEQIRVAEESKISKNKIKEVEEEWQSNLLNWKSKRRQQFVGVHLNDNEDEQNNNGPDSGRKIKTFAEMVEQRVKTGNRLNFHLQRYIGSDDSEQSQDDEGDESNDRNSADAVDDNDDHSNLLNDLDLRDREEALAAERAETNNKTQIDSLSVNKQQQQQKYPSYRTDSVDSRSSIEDDDRVEEDEQKHLQRVAFVAKLKAFERMTQPTMEEPKFVPPKAAKQPPPPPPPPSLPPTQQPTLPTKQQSPTQRHYVQPKPPQTQQLPPQLSQQQAAPIPQQSPIQRHHLPPRQSQSHQLPPKLSQQASHPQQPQQSPHKEDKAQDRTVLSVSGKKRCSSCKEELGRGAAAFVIESLNLVYHTNCFRCSVCHVNLSNGFRGVDVRVHAGALHCQNCYSKDGLNYSRV